MSQNAMEDFGDSVVMHSAPDGSGPQSDRPRMFGSHLEPVRLPWPWATARLTAARTYWIATTRPTGQPHCRPVWGIWLDDTFYFSTGSLAAQNLVANPALTLHLESGSAVVIIEGHAQTVTEVTLVERIVALYNAKYHWDVDPHRLPGPFYAVRAQVAFGWLCDETGRDGGAVFHGTATRWRFPQPQDQAATADSAPQGQG